MFNKIKNILLMTVIMPVITGNSYSSINPTLDQINAATQISIGDMAGQVILTNDAVLKFNYMLPGSEVKITGKACGYIRNFIDVKQGNTPSPGGTNMAINFEDNGQLYLVGEFKKVQDKNFKIKEGGISKSIALSDNSHVHMLQEGLVSHAKKENVSLNSDATYDVSCDIPVNKMQISPEKININLSKENNDDIFKLKFKDDVGSRVLSFIAAKKEVQIASDCFELKETNGMQLSDGTYRIVDQNTLGKQQIIADDSAPIQFGVKGDNKTYTINGTVNAKKFIENKLVADGCEVNLAPGAKFIF